MITTTHASQHEITLADLEPMPLPRAALMCAPDYFDIVDVKNPFMEGQQGKVDALLARQQWARVKETFEGRGAVVATLKPLPGCEDMVFCANPVFCGLDGSGRRVCVPSHMRYPSRQREVEAHVAWYRTGGYGVVPIEGGMFEGSGDALWHPARRLIWGGYGHRSDEPVYQRISEIFDAPVITLELTNPTFYHLDTCFCPIDPRTVLVHPPAFTPEGLASIRRVFEDVIPVDGSEANAMACNAAAFFGRHVVIQQGAQRVNRLLRDRGFEVIEVDTSEFMKSGGSVFCLKMYLF